MRVLHVIPAVAPRYGGPSMAVVPMCKALMKSDVETLVVATNADGEGRLNVPLGERTMWHGIPAIFFERNFSESFKYSADLAYWLRRHVTEFDIVHLHAVLSHACLAAASVCRGSRVPFVVRPLGTLAPWSLRQKPLRKRVLLALGGRTMVLTAGAVHCTSAEERRGIEQTFPGARPVVIPLGIDEEYLTAPEPDWADRNRDRYVLSISRLHPKKNLEALIEAFLGVASQQRERWRLVIAGDGDPRYVEQLRQKAGQAATDGRVSFAGWVDGTRKRELLQRASVFTLASFHENFGVSVLEALASGVPAIVSASVDLADEIRQANAGWVVEPRVESIAQALSDALEHAEARAARAKAAQQIARRFSWPDIASELVNLYRGLVAGRSPVGDPILSSAAPAGR